MQRQPDAPTRTRHAARRWPAVRAGLALLVTALLAACTTSLPVAGLPPVEEGNFELHFFPAEAEVILLAEGDSPVGVGRKAQYVAESGAGVISYDLTPGNYRALLSLPSYHSAEVAITFTGDDAAATTQRVEVIQLIPLPKTTPALPGGDQGGEEPPAGEAPGGETPTTPPGDSLVEARSFTFEIDPTFDPGSLSSDESLWYDRFWNAIDNPHPDYVPTRMAASDDIYVYARDLHNHLQTLLIMLGVTGDQAILEEVYRLSEIMRGELKDAWTETLDGSDGEKDGYVGWAMRYGEYPEFEGKDTHTANDLKASAIVASFAYAFQVNSQVDPRYAEAASFWQDYLINDYEAKWRERKGRPTGYPIYIRPHTHTYMSGIKYHYYMYLLTGEPAYLNEAMRASNIMWNNEFRTTQVGSLGEGYVWPRSVLSEGGSGNYLHPTTYARYALADIVELHLAGFGPWADADVEMFTRPVTEWVIDRENATDRYWFAQDIGAGVSRAGIPVDPDWKRMNTLGWSWSPYALLSHWDSTGLLGDTSEAALHEIKGASIDSPGAVHIPAGRFMEIALAN